MNRGYDGEPHTVAGWESVEDGIQEYEDNYNRNHIRGYEASMSACINFMFMQPSIIWIDSDEGLHAIVGPEPELQHCSHVSGGFLGLVTLEEVSAPMWGKGAKPRLINHHKMEQEERKRVAQRVAQRAAELGMTVSHPEMD
jgi:hypothetical protein